MELAEMAEAFDREIKRTIRENGLDFEVFEGAERQELIKRLCATFLSEEGRKARPGFVWCYLKYRPDAIDCGGKDPYWSFPEVFGGERVMYLFMPDFWDNDFFVFRGRMEDIRTFVGDCLGLDEYHLMTTDGEELFCATHHDQLFHVDARRSPRNEEGRRRWEKRAEERRRKIEEAREILARFEKSQDAGNSA